MKGHFILMKGAIHQQEISIFNIYASHMGAPIYIRKKKENKTKTLMA
jgi:hypothetical protein